MQALALVADCKSLSRETLLVGPSHAANQLQVCWHIDVGGCQHLAQVQYEQEEP